MIQKNMREKEKPKRWMFQIPREGFLDLILEYNDHFNLEDSKKITSTQALNFIDNFTRKHFVDYNEL